MKYLLVVLLCACACELSHAAPFIQSDVDTSGADKCVYQEGTVVVETSLVAGACKIDASTFASGNHNLQVWFKSTLWGVTSVKVPFAFSKPTANGIGPSNLQLTP